MKKISPLLYLILISLLSWSTAEITVKPDLPRPEQFNWLAIYWVYFAILIGAIRVVTHWGKVPLRYSLLIIGILGTLAANINWVVLPYLKWQTLPLVEWQVIPSLATFIIMWMALPLLISIITLIVFAFSHID